MIEAPAAKAPPALPSARKYQLRLECPKEDKASTSGKTRSISLERKCCLHPGVSTALQYR